MLYQTAGHSLGNFSDNPQQDPINRFAVLPPSFLSTRASSQSILYDNEHSLAYVRLYIVLVARFSIFTPTFNILAPTYTCVAYRASSPNSQHLNTLHCCTDLSLATFRAQQSAFCLATMLLLDTT